jgi:hypothetical protein
MPMNVGSGGEVIVFAGPSLPLRARPDDPRLDWRPPAVAGDALAAMASHPRAVVLVDGLFDEWPAIRHKELLSLMAEGVAVFGGASMGALRAAELHTLGMIGVGHIFDAYRRGLIDADDEVAVLHGPAAFDWSPLTEPLVNIRATLLHAVRRRVIRAPQARGLLEAARSIYYKHRTWTTILDARGLDDSTEAGGLDGFRVWLPVGYVDLKQRDALACVRAALRHGAGPQPSRPRPPQTFFTALLAEQVAKGLRPQEGYP